MCFFILQIPLHRAQSWSHRASQQALQHLAEELSHHSLPLERLPLRVPGPHPDPHSFYFLIHCDVGASEHLDTEVKPANASQKKGPPTTRNLVKFLNDKKIYIAFPNSFEIAK